MIRIKHTLATHDQNEEALDRKTKVAVIMGAATIADMYRPVVSLALQAKRLERR